MTEPAQTRSGIVALLVAATFFMEVLDATIVTPALPRMADSFSVAVIDLHPAVSAYMLTLGIFIPVSGWIADRMGARTVFASAIIVFALGSGFCGLSGSMPELLAARVLQGVGGAMMVPVGRLVVLRATPKDRLVATMARLTWPALTAPVLGPPIGGFLADLGEWRWIFWLNLPVAALALIGTLALVPDDRGDHRRPLDWIGFGLSGMGLVSLLAWSEAVTHSGLEASAMAWGVGGIALLVLAAWHMRRTPHPMVSLEALSLPTFGASFWGGSLFRMALSATLFLLPMLFQTGLGYSAFAAGAMLLPVFLGNILMKPFTTACMRSWGFRSILVVNGILNGIAIAACALIGPWLAFGLTITLLFIGGLTRSMQFTSYLTLAFADVPRAAMTGANTLFSAVLQVAMGMGVALGAVAWNIGQKFPLGPHHDTTAPFRTAFLIVTVIMLGSLRDSLRLEVDAGTHVLRSA